MSAFPYQETITRLLSANPQPFDAADVVRSAREKYVHLLAGHPLGKDRARMEKRILPALALYQAMQEHGLDPEAALRVLEPVLLETYFRRLRRGLVLFSRLPIDPFPLLRPALRVMAAPRGGQGEVILDSASELVVHTYRCPILDALRELGAPELTAIFCASDDWLASALPRIRWLRTTTLARGGKLCDFHWARADKKSQKTTF